jgi:transposase, IS5 family
MSGTAKRQFSFADWEMIHQGQKLDPILQTISDFLDNNATTIDAIRRDLESGLKNPDTGRDGLTAQQVLRALILKRVKNWDLRELRERIADGITLRQFTDFYANAVPKHQAFKQAFNRRTPETIKSVNEIVVKAAVELKLEDGNKLRNDTTVVQTNIHHPTDNTLMWAIPRSE